MTLESGLKRTIESDKNLFIKLSLTENILKHNIQYEINQI